MKNKPMLLVMAGPNGSGKSTLWNWFDSVGEYTNADDIVSATGMDNLEAAKFVDKKRYAAIESRADFSFETVLSSEYKMDIIREAKSADYFIKIIFVLTADPKINKSRVKARVASGGHNVDKAKIVERYYKSIANIPELMQLADIMHIYDNSGRSAVRIVRKHKEDISVYPNEYWSAEQLINLIVINETE